MYYNITYSIIGPYVNPFGKPLATLGRLSFSAGLKGQALRLPIRGIHTLELRLRVRREAQFGANSEFRIFTLSQLGY